MTSVFLAMTIAVSNGLMGFTVQPTVRIFVNAKQCAAYAESTEKKMKLKYDKVSSKCYRMEVHK